jgi:hypothetical protein
MEGDLNFEHCLRGRKEWDLIKVKYTPDGVWATLRFPILA